MTDNDQTISQLTSLIDGKRRIGKFDVSGKKTLPKLARASKFTAISTTLHNYFLRSKK